MLRMVAPPFHKQKRTKGSYDKHADRWIAFRGFLEGKYPG